MLPDWTADAGWPAAAAAVAIAWFRERKARRDSQQTLIDSLFKRVDHLEERVTDQETTVRASLEAKAELAGQLLASNALLAEVTAERDRLLGQIGRRASDPPV